MEQPAPRDGLPPNPANRCPRCRVHTGSQNSPVASGLIKSTFYYPFPCGASLSLGNKVIPCRNFFPGKIVSQKGWFPGCPWFSKPRFAPLCSKKSKAFPSYFRQGAAFRFLSQPERLLGLHITAAQNKEKQIEMTMVITVKGTRGCVSVSMANAIFRRLILPAVKTRFMLGVGKSKP